MLIDTNLCMGCMNEKGYEGPCKICGVSESDPCFPSYLLPRTFLNERYIVGKLLSYNGEGAVYIGFDTVAKSKVTVKEFMPDTLCTRKKGETNISVNANNSPLYKTYMSEFADLNRSLMKLRGIAHIQVVLDVFYENNTCYAILEHITGVTLKSFLASTTGGLSWEQVREMFPPILTTLSLVHAAGIIHRGISPSTIYVTDKMQLKLGGFAISAARTTNTEIACEVFAGFAAPEQYNNEPNGTWTDVYGISAVLYKVLTTATPPEAIARTGSGMPEPAMVSRNIPQNVSRAIMAGMRLSVEGRVRTITDLVDKLFTPPKLGEGRNESGKGVVPSAREEKILRKKKKEQMKLLSVLVVAGLVLIVFAITFSLTLSGACAKDPDDALSGSSSESSVSSSVRSDKSSSSIDVTLPSVSQPIQIADTTVVPDFVNESWRYENAVKTYEGLLTISPTYDYNDTFVEGLIFEQSVDPGTEVEKGTEIKVKVSKGPSVVSLPEYMMKPSSGYVDELTELNIKYLIKEEESAEVFEGNVVHCERENGVEIQPGDPVNVEGAETIIVYVAIPVTAPPESSTPPTESDISSAESSTPPAESSGSSAESGADPTASSDPDDNSDPTNT